MAITIDGAGTITGLDADGISSQPVFAGNVLQVVQGAVTGSTSTSSSTRSDTGLSASITPQSASNKILVFVNMVGNGKNSGSGTGPYGAYWLMRGATDITKFEGEVGYTGNTNNNSTGSCSTVYLDSPTTVTETTYKVQFANIDNEGNVIFGLGNSTSTITLMEIAG